jgi:hypothetical protein
VVPAAEGGHAKASVRGSTWRPDGEAKRGTPLTEEGDMRRVRSCSLFVAALAVAVLVPQAEAVPAANEGPAVAVSGASQIAGKTRQGAGGLKVNAGRVHAPAEG